LRRLGLGESPAGPRRFIYVYQAFVRVAETAAPNKIQFNSVGGLRAYIIFMHSAFQ
jgi:hypothetical protein